MTPLFIDNVKKRKELLLIYYDNLTQKQQFEVLKTLGLVPNKTVKIWADTWIFHDYKIMTADIQHLEKLLKRYIKKNL